MRRLYCIYDLVAACFIGQLVSDRADAPVIRMFHDLLKDDKTPLGAHPDDYEVRFIGTVADDGQLLPVDPEVIATGKAWLASQARDPLAAFTTPERV